MYDQLRLDVQRQKDERHGLEEKFHELQAAQKETFDLSMQKEELAAKLDQNESRLADVCSPIVT